MKNASMKSLHRVCVFVASAAIVTGLVPVTQSAATDEEVNKRADALIAQMTPQEKAGQLSLYFYLSQMPQMLKGANEALDKGELGALLFVADPAEVNRLQKVAVEKTRLKIPLLFGYDVIHGLHTIFPVPLGMTASWDPNLLEQVQSIAAREARAVGIHWVFAPNVDVARDPRWGRLVEGVGEDPYLGAAMATAQVRGFQGASIGSPGRVIAGPKHFVGYGAALGGRDYDEVNLSDNELWNVYLPPFKAAVDAGAGNIMTAYMPLNGVPATGNRWLLTKVLRETWGFKGFVVSDSNAVSGLTRHGLSVDAQDAAVRALKAGVNVELAAPGRPPAVQFLPAAVAAGKISEAEINDAVRAVLSAKIRMGLFESPYVKVANATAVLADPAHLQAARVAAERSAVLLRNENGVLPLDRNSLKSIAVIGPLADAPRDTLGPWVFPMNKPSSVSILSGLRTKLGTSIRIEYSEGVRLPARLHPSPIAMFDGSSATQKPEIDEAAELQRAVALAGNADVSILVLGEGQDMAGELASRSTFDLPGRQQELLDAVVATGKPVVLILMSARPLDLKETKAAAILDIWYPGSEGGSAVANLLFDDATPGGKLPFTWLRNAAQAPLIYARLNSHDPTNAHKRYWNESNQPTYPFGYGLSYTTFEYSNLTVERAAYAPGDVVTISVDVKNSGARNGDEVAQLYIHQRSGTSARPVRELKGFQRVTLKPGEVRNLSFTLRPDDLEYWSAATGDWVRDQSKFDVWVGGSSEAGLAGSFEVKQP